MLMLFLSFQSLPAQNNALWVWNTRQIIDQPEWRDSLLSVTRPLNVNTLFLYFSYDLSDDGDTVTLYNKEGLVSLLRWARENSFQVHALAGEPEWALRWNHHKPLAFARAVIDLRKETGFPDGIQFDIEPYLLLQFSLQRTKQQLLKDWINLVWKTGRMIREQGELVYGIAVPFWLEDPITVETITMPVGNHLTFLTDYLAIMSYRNTAEGSASVISFSENERRWAEHARRKVYVGVETQRLTGSVSHLLCQVDPDSFARRYDMENAEYAEAVFERKRISVESVSGTLLLGVGGGDLPDSQLVRIRRKMMEHFGGKEISVSVPKLARHYQQSGEGEEPSALMLSDGSEVIRVASKELKRSTMFGLSPKDFLREYSILMRYAERYPEVEGVAVHDLRSVKRLLEMKD